MKTIDGQQNRPSKRGRAAAPCSGSRQERGAAAAVGATAAPPLAPMWHSHTAPKVAGCYPGSTAFPWCVGTDPCQCGKRHSATPPETPPQAAPPPGHGVMPGPAPMYPSSRRPAAPPRGKPRDVPSRRCSSGVLALRRHPLSAPLTIRTARWARMPEASGHLAYFSAGSCVPSYACPVRRARACLQRSGISGAR